LVKNLLAHHGENSFYDKKRRIDISTKEGKAKFLKHVCALANSNPKNNAYILIGVEDQNNEVVGVDFFDDSRIQNLVNAYLNHPPQIIYENILFPALPPGKVVGLVTIRSLGAVCSLRKNIWKYWGGTVFIREGSISLPKDTGVVLPDINTPTVSSIELQAQNSIGLTLDGVMDFMVHRHKDLECHYKVFVEQFVVCWAGIPKTVKGITYYSRVDIEMITEQVKLFYSALDEVEIAADDRSLTITEYVRLGLGHQKKYFPFETTRLQFSDNGRYTLASELIFQPPQYNKKTLLHLQNTSLQLMRKVEKSATFAPLELEELSAVPEIFLLCYLNEIPGVLELMEQAKDLLRPEHPKVYAAMKEALRILRKVKYNQ
jgi:hypothetical protein